MAPEHSPYRLAHVRDQITEAFSHTIASDNILQEKGAPAKGTAAGELAIAVRELGNAVAGVTEKVEFLLTQQARYDTVEEANRPFYAGANYRQKQEDLRRRVEALERQCHVQEDTADPQVKEPNGTKLDLGRLADTLRGKRHPQDARPPDKVEVIVHGERTDILGQQMSGTATVGVKLTLDGRLYGHYTPLSVEPYQRPTDLLYAIERLCREMRTEGLPTFLLTEGLDPKRSEG